MVIVILLTMAGAFGPPRHRRPVIESGSETPGTVGRMFLAGGLVVLLVLVAVVVSYVLALRK